MFKVNALSFSLNARWKIPVIGAMAFLIGMTSMLAVQVVEPDIVAAATNGPERSDDHRDGNGDSHYTKVTYTRQLSPWKATVRSIRIGGRPVDDNIWCTHKESWRNKYSKYWRWNGSKWVLVKTKKGPGWLETSKTSLTYHYDDEDVTLTGGAAVTHRNEYQVTDKCMNAGSSTTAGASIHQHYLE